MKLSIVWTPEAVRSLEEIKNKLEECKTEEELSFFIGQVFAVLTYLGKFPTMYEASKSSMSQHKAYITEEVSLIYRYKQGEQELHLLQFWDKISDQA